MDPGFRRGSEGEERAGAMERESGGAVGQRSEEGRWRRSVDRSPIHSAAHICVRGLSGSETLTVAASVLLPEQLFEHVGHGTGFGELGLGSGWAGLPDMALRFGCGLIRFGLRC